MDGGRPLSQLKGAPNVSSSRAISMASVSSEGSTESPLVEQEDIASLTHDVRNFKEALGKLRRTLCPDKDKQELLRIAAHERLGEVIRVLRSVLDKYPALQSTELLQAAGNLIHIAKNYKDDNPIPKDFLEAIDQLALSFSGRVSEYLMGDLDTNFPLSGSVTSKTKSCENLAQDPPPPVGPRRDKTPKKSCPEQIDDTLIKIEQGVDYALSRAKCLARYIKDVMTYIENRSHLDIEYTKNLIKLAQTVKSVFKEEPMSLRRAEHEKTRRQIKDVWHSEVMCMRESVSSMRRARDMYVQRQEDLQRFKEMAQRTPADVSEQGKQERRQQEEELLKKAQNAETSYKRLLNSANERQIHLDKVKLEVLQQLRELIVQSDQVIKDTAVTYFQMQHTLTTPIPMQGNWFCLVEIQSPGGRLSLGVNLAGPMGGVSFTRANSECWRWVLRWSRHGRLREHVLWSGLGSREGGWRGRCKCGGKIRGPTEHRLYESGSQYFEFVKRIPQPQRPPKDVNVPTRPPFKFRPYTAETTARYQERKSSESNEYEEVLPGKSKEVPIKNWSSHGGSDSDSICSNHSHDTSPVRYRRYLGASRKILNASSGDELDNDGECSFSISGGNQKPRMSKAAETHNFRKLKTPSRCRECDSYVYFQGLECSECTLTCHKKCLESLTIQCGHRKLPPKMTTFGVDLGQHLSETGALVPHIVIKCIDEIDERGILHKGIYRISGAKGKIEKLCQAFENGADLVDLGDSQINVIATVLKLYLRQLPEPLLTFKCYSDMMRIAKEWPSDKSKDLNGALTKLKEVVKRLPRSHYLTLELLMLHLKRVSNHAGENSMPASNLGIVFGPTLLRTMEGGDPLSSLVDTMHQTRAIEIMIW
uniref:Minor histocompatibility protein HA-1 n=1 Tax=Timema cristinae TaxID=61476 RepID=A0A7R9D1F8_TIMCR|nr:unnamed protein product [Timema cristinae]